MKRSIIIMLIVMIISFILSAMFFFNSGFFDFSMGQVTEETVGAFSSEMERFFYLKFN